MSRVFWAIALALSPALSLVGQVPKTQPEKTDASRPSASVANTLETEIRQAWQDFKDRKKDAFAAALADDDTEVWVDGKLRDKTTAVKDVDTVTLNSYSLSNIKIMPLGPRAALATYRVKADGLLNGQQFNSNLEVTEVFVKRGAEWKELRYHESEIK